MDTHTALLWLLLWASLLATASTSTLQCHCSRCLDAYCTIDHGACFTTTDSNDVLLTGCLSEDLASLMCNQSDSSVQCCRSNHCNLVPAGVQRFLRNEEEVTATTMTPMPDNSILLGAIIALVIVGTIVIVSLVVAALCCFLYRRQQRKTQHPVSTVEAPPTPEVRCTAQSSNCRAILHQSENIGSLVKAAMFYGHSLSPLVQRSITQQTALEKPLTKGTFSSRYTGRWRSDRVAVTVFNAQHQHLWANELAILQLPLMRHEGVLSFIAADTVVKKDLNYHYLISEYHARGSLGEHLAKSSLEVPEALLLVTSLVAAVQFLHSEVVQENRGATIVKPSIAHCNLSSRNVYVDKSGSCCLSDFALAVTQSNREGVPTPQSRGCVPAPQADVRYLAPEILAGTDIGFEGQRRGDMYAVGLILWEVANCCLVQGENCVYSLPYSDLLDSKATPTRDDMMRIVCKEGKRPPLPEHCSRDESMRLVLATMEECWSATPSQRPTAHTVKDTLQASLLPTSKWQLTVDKNGQTVYKQSTA